MVGLCCWFTSVYLFDVCESVHVYHNVHVEAGDNLWELVLSFRRVGLRLPGLAANPSTPEPSLQPSAVSVARAVVRS